VLGRHQDALKDISKAVELDPNSAGNYFTRERRYLLSDELQAAVRDLTRAIELEEPEHDRPFSEAARFFRAEAYLRLGRCDLALADCAALPEEFALYVKGMRSRKDIELEAKKHHGG
jgi:tetratricopeptide (TPR) repeat protein